jgi:CRP-like cAMP-binding protein
MPKAMQYTKRSIIYFTGDRDEQIYVLQRGLIHLTGTDIETGEEITGQINPGEFFGIKSALGRFPREETASVVADSLVIALTIPEFEQVFSSNKQLILKMLKVFSTELRNLHRKTEKILDSTATVDQASGMIEVAKSFYEDSQYQACCDVCNKLLKLFPNNPDKDVVSALLKESKLRKDRLAGKQKRQELADEPMSQFSLPAFDRFSRQFEEGSVIIAEHEPGDTFYLIRSGLVQSVKCVNGVKKNLDILKQGEFFGEMAILENIPRSATCVALTKVDTLEFTKENFELLVTGNPQMAIILLKLFCKRIYDQQRRFKILCISDYAIRIADVFMMYDEMSPSMGTDKRRTFNLTIQEIAHWAGIPVDVAHGEIKKLVDTHRLEIFETSISVTNIADIRRMVESRVQVRRTNP